MAQPVLGVQYDRQVRTFLLLFRLLSLVVALLLVLFSPHHSADQERELLITVVAVGYTLVYAGLFRTMRTPGFVGHLVWGGLDLLLSGFFLYYSCIELPEFFLYVVSPIFTATYFLGFRMGLAAAAAMALFYNVALWLRFDSLTAIFRSQWVGVYLANMAGYFMAAVIFNSWINLLHHLKKEMEKIERMNEELRRLQGQLQDLAVLRERNRLAREVHDRVASKLYGIALRLQIISLRVPETCHEALMAVRDQVLTSQAELKECIQAMYRDPLPSRNFSEVVQEMAEYFRQNFELPIEVVLPRESIILDSRRLQELTYILSEALTNVRKHAHAAHVKVSVIPRKGKYRLVIEDDGQGCDFTNGASRRGLGLAAMRSRAEEIGGYCLIESSPGKGTRVEVEFPASEIC